MRKIFLSMMTIALVGALIGGGVYAYFSDIESSTENTFTAGTLDLELTDTSEDGTDGETQTWVFTDMKPTDTGGATLNVNSKAGSIDGFIDLSSISVTDDEGTNPESETSGGNDLSDLLMVHMFFDVDGDGVYDIGDGDTDIYGTSASYAQFSSMASAYDTDYALSSGGTIYITLNYNWPSSANDNDAQGDVTTFTFDVELDQSAD
jgi:predicted ribosomally synthesized peptide with SipW-like signal peptide